jgi:Urocanase Rossmann-like domain
VRLAGATGLRNNALPPEPPSAAILSFIARVHQDYAALMRFATPNEANPDDVNLGGKLLYAGQLDDPGRALTVAANIAGAATLAASAHAPALRQAQRDAVIDFLVNALDEALRILKNEVRKRRPVAVAVSIAPGAIVQEMLDRGVLPDLLPPLTQSSPAPSGFDAFLAQGSRNISTPPSHPESRLLIWPIPAEYAQRPAAFDALLIEQLPPHDRINRRWLGLSPRYLGPAARRLRSLACDAETAAKLIVGIGPPLQP